jgi:7,8-dihydropterin-6-yl-methyl-4-(beta-D-ribofuranosyl)aminobenzene 5'-phosphate synthase
MENLMIEPGDIDIIFLSHIHQDHVGALWNVIEKNSEVTVYLLKSFPEEFKGRVKKSGAVLISVDKPIEICDNVFSNGELGGIWIKEQSLIINTKKGLIIVTGCAHPGIVNIVKTAKEFLNKNIYLVMGGFHLRSYSENEVKNIINELKKLEVTKVGPSHCTGGRPIELFKESWGEDFFDLGCGAIFELEFED